MPPEGPNKSEELLKRYAQERREQAPNLPLHPATRRLLQGEVTRQFGKKSENRSWSWLGILRGRLAIGTALGAVVVTGACIWWNNQKPQPMEMAKAERTETEFVLPSRSSSDEMKLKVEKQIAAVDAPSRVQFEDEARRRAPAAPVERAIRTDLNTAQPGAASATSVAGGRALALNEPMAATSTFSVQSSLARGPSKSGDFGSGLGSAAAERALATNIAHLAGVEFDSVALSSSVPRASFAATATAFKSATNRTDLALAYGLQSSEPSLPTALPSVALTLADGERKEASKLSDTAKLAEGLTVALAPDGGIANFSTRARLEPQAPMVQPPATTTQPVRALEERVAADKRQQPPATLRGQLVTQAATSPKPNEATTRYYRQPTLTADATASKQKALSLDRLDAEPAVLNRFVIEQQGNSVRVVDADGSVYDGKVEEPVVTAFDSDLYETYPEKKDQLAREKPVALKSPPAPQIEGYSFRASGSNVTLRQMVVVNGRFAPAADSVRFGAAGGAGAAANSPASAPAPIKSGTVSNRANGGQQPGFGGRYGYTTNQPATIEGTVRIGVTNQQWFRAVRNPR